MRHRRALLSVTTRDSWIFGGLILLLLWLPLPWGSYPQWARGLFAGFTGMLLGLWSLGAALGWVRVRPSPWQLWAPALWWIAWLGWIALSLYPLQPDTLASLSPTAAALYQQAGTLGADVTPRLTTTPALTTDALLLSVGYACLYFLVLVTCHGDPQRARMALIAVVVSGLLQALYGSLMVLSGLEIGFFEQKLYYREVATGTFVNRNHLAGYLELAGAAALGLILGELGDKTRWRGFRRWLLDLISFLLSPKVRFRIALAVMTIGLVMTRSRMGNIAFVSAVVACGLLYVFLRHRDRSFGAIVLFGSVLIVDLVIVTQWYGLDVLVDRLENTNLEAENRNLMFGLLPSLASQYVLTGSGLGSFAVSFAPHRPLEMWLYYEHAHNDYFQFLIEVGAPGVALLAIFVLAHVLHALRVIVVRRRKLAAAVAFPALMATVALALHSLTDFNLQVPANAATYIALLALSSTIPGRSGSRRRTRRSRDDDVSPESAPPASEPVSPSQTDSLAR
jgi:putative inorganic carbon (HCO3(-)) transporter